MLITLKSVAGDWKLVSHLVQELAEAKLGSNLFGAPSASFGPRCKFSELRSQAG